jgi:hypothetical protein
MNERIKKLAEQAGLRFTQLMSNPMVPVVDGKETDLEKFAELLIKECISIVEEQKECLHEEQQYWHDRDYGYEMAVNDASMGIKQFFGVEL